MATCSRCDVARSMHRYGAENIVEVRTSHPTLGMVCRIFKRVTDLRKDPIKDLREAIWIEGQLYVWFVTIFSDQHSRDNDCDVNLPGRKKIFRGDEGYPRLVPVENTAPYNPEQA